MASELKVKIVADTKGAVKGIRTADGQIKKLGRSVDQAGKSMSRFGSIAKTALAAISAVAIVGITRAVANLARKGFRVLHESVQLAGVQQIAERKLEQALATMGDTSAESAKKLKELASEMQGVSNFGDETIITAQAMLLSFKEVGGAEGTALLTPRMLDMAAGMAKVSGAGTDLNTVAQAIGRSMTQGAGALSRYGISMTEVEKASFNAAEGMERVEILTQVLDNNFKGLAEATVDPFKQLSNSVGDLKEDIGQELRPELEALARQIKDFVEDPATVNFAQESARGLIDFSRLFIEFFQFRMPIATNRFQAIATEHVASVIETIGKFKNIILDVDGANPFQGTIDKLRGVADAATKAKEELLDRELQQFIDRIEAGNRGAGAAPTAPTGPGATRTPDRPPIEVIKSTIDEVIEGTLKLGQALTVDLLGSVSAVDDALSILDQALLRVGTQGQRDAILDEIAAFEELRSTMMGVQSQSEQLAEAEKKRTQATVQANTMAVLSSQNALQSLIGIAKQVIAAELAKTIAKNLSALGPAALIVGPAVAAGIVGLFNSLVPKFGAGGSSGGGAGGVGRRTGAGGVGGIGRTAGGSSRSVGRDLSQGVRPFTPNAPVRTNDVSIQGELIGRGEDLRAVIRASDKRIGRTREGF